MVNSFGGNDYISIHALLAESDVCLCRLSLITLPISIHALLAESDGPTGRPAGVIILFLSTLSLRRATHLFASSGVDFAISIHALLAESDAPPYNLMIQHKKISIHALLAESD